MRQVRSVLGDRMSGRLSRHILRIFLAPLLVLGGASLAAVAPAAASPPPDTTSGWIPTDAPLPSSLPSGLAPVSMTLYATSCASAAFCVSVGYVEDSAPNAFPLVETWDGTTWTASIAPLPADSPAGGWSGSFLGVSCPAAGQCVAVGSYSAYLGSRSFGPNRVMLSTDSAGTWTSVQPPQPLPQDELDSEQGEAVSCSSTTQCTAVATAIPSSAGLPIDVVWTDSGEGWELGELPVPSGAAYNLEVSSISCPDASDCTAVGWYNDINWTTYPLLLTLSDGIWTASVAPLPPDAVSPDQGAFTAVDCPEVGYCVAVGYYEPTTQPAGIIEAMVDVLSDGTWTSVAAPLPADAPAGAWSELTGVSCASAGVCSAAGSFQLVSAAGPSGMVLTQTADGWTAADAPAPPGTVSPRSTQPAPAVASPAPPSGLSCDDAGLCGAALSENGQPVVAVQQLEGLLAVAGVSPTSGNAGSTVTVDGSGFVPGDTVDFGPVPAADVNVVSSDELQATVPAGVDGSQVDVAVSGGGTTSHAEAADQFTYGFVEGLSVHVSGAANADPGEVAYSATLSGAGGVPTGSITVADGATGGCTMTLAAGTGRCSIDETPLRAPATYDLTWTYSGDATYDAATGHFAEVVRGKVTSVATSVSAVSPTGKVTYSTVVSGWSALPSGNVRITDGKGKTCTARLSAGAGSCSITEVPGTSYTATASYGGDANYESAHATVALGVGVVSATTAATVVWAVPATTGDVTYHVLVAGSHGVPTGGVVVGDGGGRTCTAPLGPSAQASCEIAEPGAGSPYTVTATYGGNGVYAASSAALTEVVSRAAAKLTISVKVPGKPGNVTFTATVAAVAGIVPTGTVAVSDGAAGTCTITLAAGAGSCVLAEPAGSRKATFTYSGDGSFTPASRTTGYSVG